MSDSRKPVRKEQSKTPHEVERDIGGVDQLSSSNASSRKQSKSSDVSSAEQTAYQLSAVRSAVEHILESQKENPGTSEFSEQLNQLLKNVGDAIAKCTNSWTSRVSQAGFAGMYTLVVGPAEALAEYHEDSAPQVSLLVSSSVSNYNSPDLNTRHPRSASDARSLASQLSVKTSSTAPGSAKSQNSKIGGNDALHISGTPHLQHQFVHSQCEVGIATILYGIYAYYIATYMS